MESARPTLAPGASKALYDISGCCVRNISLGSGKDEPEVRGRKSEVRDQRSEITESEATDGVLAI